MFACMQMMICVYMVFADFTTISCRDLIFCYDCFLLFYLLIVSFSFVITKIEYNMHYIEHRVTPI